MFRGRSQSLVSLLFQRIKLRWLVYGLAVVLLYFFVSYLVTSGNKGVDGYNFGNVLVQCFYRSYATLETYQREPGARVIQSLSVACNSKKGFLDEKYPTDKCSDHSYTTIYDQLFANRRDAPVRLLEVGVKKGGSLKLWRDFFSYDSMIYGLDINVGVPMFPKEPNIKVLVGDSMESEFPQFEKQCLDVVVDDGYHAVSVQIFTLANLGKYVCPKTGLYLVEDVIDIDGMKEFLDTTPPMPLTYKVHMDKSGQALFVISVS